METRLRRRLESLRGEYDKGRKALEGLEAQTSELRATLLRISGAIQVLQEELDGDPAAARPVAPRAIPLDGLLGGGASAPGASDGTPGDGPLPTA